MPKVRLFDQHTQNGVENNAGTEIEMSVEHAKWYRDMIAENRHEVTRTIQAVEDQIANKHDPAAGVAAAGPNADQTWDEAREAKKK